MTRSSVAGASARPRKNMRLAVKLPLLVAISSLISILVLGAADYWLASNDIRSLSADKLTALLDARTSTLNRLFRVENQSVERLANSLQIKEANDSFASGWALEGDSRVANLRRLFIDENPNPADQRAELTKPEERTPYTRYHNRFHVDLRGIATERQYRSLMLVSLTGDVIYTVNKRNEFGRNINDTDFPYPGLSGLLKGVMADPANTPVAYGDFLRNVPGLISRFIVSPIIADKGDVRGYLVVEEPVSEINDVTADPAGLGNTGSIYLVGPDRLLRTVDRQMDDVRDASQAVLTVSHDTAPVGAALGGAALQSRAASKAADATTQAASESNAMQQYIFDRQTEMSAPARRAGRNALAILQSEMGIGNTPSFGSGGQRLHIDQGPQGAWRVLNEDNRALGYYNTRGKAQNYMNDHKAGFKKSPGYQFRRKQGEKAIERASSARGLRFAAGTMKDFARFNQGLASDEYGNYMNHLHSLSGTGQTANSQQAQAGNVFASNVSANNMNAADARGSSYMAGANAAGGAINSLGSIYGAAKGGYFGPEPGFGISPYPSALKNFGY